MTFTVHSNCETLTVVVHYLVTCSTIRISYFDAFAVSVFCKVKIIQQYLGWTYREAHWWVCFNSSHLSAGGDPVTLSIVNIYTRHPEIYWTVELKNGLNICVKRAVFINSLPVPQWFLFVYIVRKTILPLHGCSLHFSVCSAGPKPPQLFPPFDGGGFVHERRRLRVAPPHNLEHWPQAPQRV